MSPATLASGAGSRLVTCRRPAQPGRRSGPPAGLETPGDRGPVADGGVGVHGRSRPWTPGAARHKTRAPGRVRSPRLARRPGLATVAEARRLPAGLANLSTPAVDLATGQPAARRRAPTSLEEGDSASRATGRPTRSAVDAAGSKSWPINPASRGRWPSTTSDGRPATVTCGRGPGRSPGPDRVSRIAWSPARRVLHGRRKGRIELPSIWTNRRSGGRSLADEGFKPPSTATARWWNAPSPG